MSARAPAPHQKVNTALSAVARQTLAHVIAMNGVYKAAIILRSTPHTLESAAAGMLLTSATAARLEARLAAP